MIGLALFLLGISAGIQISQIIDKYERKDIDVG
jgi:hypothetical protein